ncbi:unnamed protein product [Anisakis simplex]|uniref:ZP domain-containing protein n=1 Tax=Anisakis simplex TaxID=6269 RepID=A0A0M3K3L9_ANISI|nr:unnamed protein product [Anisakis simplex]
MSRRRCGVTYNVNQTGIGRIIFNEDRSKFQGLLVNDDGECISFNGSAIPGTDDPTTSLMNITVIDGETGDQFGIHGVAVNFAPNPNPISSNFFVTINSQHIKFTTTDVLFGNRADVEIRKFMDPRKVECGSKVHLGEMSIHLTANHRIKPSIRRESVCDNCNSAILEMSDDFLA